jgi:hypothetical protein
MSLLATAALPSAPPSLPVELPRVPGFALSTTDEATQLGATNATKKTKDRS